MTTETTKTHNPMLDTTHLTIRGAELPDDAKETVVGAAIEDAEIDGLKHSLHEVIINGVRAALVLILPKEAIVATYKAGRVMRHESVAGEWKATHDGIISAYLQANKHRDEWVNTPEWQMRVVP